MAMLDLSGLSIVLSPAYGWAALAVTGWLVLCWVCLAPARRRQSVIQPGAGWLIAYASQSGAARRIAEQHADALGKADHKPTLVALNQLQPEALAGYTQALFIVSTYGEGEAPDNAAGFWNKARQARPDLLPLSYALLALGDSQYAGFCAFGRQLDQWLSSAGAQQLLPRIEVDQLQEHMLQSWHTQIRALCGLPAADTDSFTRWTLSERRQLNPDSPGAPVWLIRLRPVGGMPDWQGGDLALVRIGQLLRSYSLASLPEDGVLELLVRQVIHADGTMGRGSSWLCCHAGLNETIELQIRPNPQFHLAETPGPAILIGAGTGLAGLRGLLKQRQRLGYEANWLVFGERSQRHDCWMTDEFDAWVTQGTLTLDRCFSRGQEHIEYVQHRLELKAEQLRQWVDRGACIYVCGSLAGVGSAVHQTLQLLLSDEQWLQLHQQNRYRRDLY